MNLEGYAILEKKKNVKLLCFRGGYSLKSLISSQNCSGVEIISLLNKELNLTNRDLKIKGNHNYVLHRVTLKNQNFICSKLNIFFRGFIDGILIVKH